MSRAQDRAFEATDLKADKAADELGMLLDRLTARLSDSVAPTYAIERMIASLAARQPELLSLFSLALDQHTSLLPDSPSTNCQRETLH
jgi:hypothetical protein